jgi:hypothetical protein
VQALANCRQRDVDDRLIEEDDAGAEDARDQDGALDVLVAQVVQSVPDASVAFGS